MGRLASMRPVPSRRNIALSRQGRWRLVKALRRSLAALGHECSEPMGLGVGKVKVVGRAVRCGDADRETAAALMEMRLTISQRAL
jgi:hypothetical protein